MEFPVRTIKDFGKVVFSILFLLSFYSCKNSNSQSVPEKDEIVITVKSDGNIKIQEADRFTAKKGDKWEKLKSSAEAKIKVDDGFEIKSWHLGDVAGVALKGSYQFNKDSTVVVTSKRKALVTASYKVEHWKQNIENDEYEKEEDEAKTGEVGKDTEAASKTYAGFKAKAVSQAKVKADGSTVVRIEYDRNITSIVLDLDGGETTTQLEAGEGNRKLLKGKFGAKVEIENPTKQGSLFVGWKPALPEKFLAEDDGAVYKAQWSDFVSLNVLVSGDERLDIGKDVVLSVQAGISKTWGSIKSQVVAKVPLKAEWSNGQYGIYEWRENDENGKLIDDETQVEDGMKLFAISNFMQFKMEGTKLLGYEGDRKHDNRPKGKIIIPAQTTEISNAYYRAFAECHRITSVDFSRCVNLTKIERDCFYHCMQLESVNFSGCVNLDSISGFVDCNSLRSIDLSPCKNLTTIAAGAFGINKSLNHINLSGLTKLTTIEEFAFAGSESLKTIDLSDLVNLESIAKFAFVSCYSLESIDLSKCNKLTKIGEFAFDENRSRLGAQKLIVKLPKSIKTLGICCFGSYDGSNSDKDFRCKRVIVPNDAIKQKVIATDYPENRITIEP